MLTPNREVFSCQSVTYLTVEHIYAVRSSMNYIRGKATLFAHKCPVFCFLIFVTERGRQCYASVYMFMCTSFVDDRLPVLLLKLEWHCGIFKPKLVASKLKY